jgi:hypothetical protein
MSKGCRSDWNISNGIPSELYIVGMALPKCSPHSSTTSSATAAIRLVASCRRVGRDYVSCSPFLVPIAWLVTQKAAFGDASGPH